jgi:hypothetical protein
MSEGQSSVDARTQWARVAAGSFGVMVAGLGSMLVIALVIIPPVLLFGVIFAALAYAVWRWHARRWVLALLAVIGNLDEDLAHPETIAGFAPNVVILLTALLGAGAAVAAPAGVNTALRRPTVVVVAALAVVLVAVSAVATLGLDDDDVAGLRLVVVAKDVEYPARLTASAGVIAFYVDNQDPIRHTFVIDGEDVEQELPGSIARRVAVTLAAGSYRFYRDVPGHDDMEGTLEVS